jgi:hypothetical protein
VYAVSTTSRGIGAEFARQLLVRTADTKVIALARTTASEKLHALQQSYPNRLSVVQVDLEDQRSVDNAAAAIAGQTDRLDLLVNVAGILGDGATTPGPERSLGGIDRDWLRKTMEINLVGHVMMTKGLVPLLKKPKAGPSQIQEVARVVNLSARVGSIGDNGLGGWYSYRMSKAALNQVRPCVTISDERHHLNSQPLRTHMPSHHAVHEDGQRGAETFQRPHDEHTPGHDRHRPVRPVPKERPTGQTLHGRVQRGLHA